MFFFSIWLIFFGLFWLISSFFHARHKVIISLFSSLLISTILQVLEQFYLSSILVVAFIFYFIIGNINTFKHGQLKLTLAVLFSVSVVTIVLSFTYFNQTIAPSDSEVLRVMFIYYPLLIIFIACYMYILLCVFNFKILQTPNPFGYVINQIRRFRRMVHLFWIISRKGLNHLIQQDHAQLPYAIADVLDQMGGVFVKFAQVLSTKKDVLPSHYIEAFSNLHDQVQPLSKDELKVIIDSKIGNIEDMYVSFDMDSIAAASIGQVHLAQLKSTKEQVVVKILRPQVKQKMTIDLDLLIQFVSWLSERSKQIKRLGLVQLAEGFKQNLLEETDFDIEALNTNLLAKAFQENRIPIIVPKIYSEYSNKQVLTMEYIKGSSFTQAVSHDVTEMLMHAFLTQILIIGIFHADPHPGNLILTNDGKVALIDFGSVGYLSDDERNGMLHFLIGYGNQDIKQMAKGLINVCEEDSLLDERLVEQRLSRLLVEASFSHDPTSTMMRRLVIMITDMGLSLKPTVAGAFRTIITLDGTLSSVDPTFSLSESSQSYASSMNKGHMVKDRIDKVKGQIEDYIPKLLELPLLKNNRIMIAHDENHSSRDMMMTFTISIFTIICLVVMLASFFIHGEMIRFVLSPLSISGFGVGMIVLITLVIRQLKLRL